MILTWIVIIILAWVVPGLLVTVAAWHYDREWEDWDAQDWAISFIITGISGWLAFIPLATHIENCLRRREYDRKRKL